MLKLYVKGLWLKEKAVEALKDESGMGTIEIAIIIIVLIALALIFKTRITDFMNGIFDKMSVEKLM